MTWTTSVVPTFAPSMSANAGTSPNSPLPTNVAVISAVAVLLCSSVVMPMPARKRCQPIAQAITKR